MKNYYSSEKHQNNNLKAIISFFKFIGGILLKDITAKEDILSFLQNKIE
jgi:hypothetical protein